MTDKLITQAFFSLLRAGLWKKTPDFYFLLDEKQWEDLFHIARMQTVEGLVYDGLLLLPPDRFPPKPLLLKWTVLIDQMEKRNFHMNKCIEGINAWLTDEKIPPLLLKGQGVAACYEEPNHRMCGDIDLYFSSEDHFVKAKTLLTQRKINFAYGHDLSLEYNWKNIPVEYHTRLVDIHNPFVTDYLYELEQNEKSRMIQMDFGSQRVQLPSPLLTHLTVNTHILKHSLSFGIGLRQLCDSARIAYTFCDRINGDALKAIYKKLGIYRWMDLLNQLLVNFLGTPEECLPFVPDKKTDVNWMMDEILATGNFGFADKRFGNKEVYPWIKRSNTIRHLLHRFKLYVRYVPSEACWFPVVQLYSRIRSLPLKRA